MSAVWLGASPPEEGKRPSLYMLELSGERELSISRFSGDVMALTERADRCLNCQGERCK